MIRHPPCTPPSKPSNRRTLTRHTIDPADPRPLVEIKPATAHEATCRSNTAQGEHAGRADRSVGRGACRDGRGGQAPHTGVRDRVARAAHG
eukprot:7014071-Prymnesium_polylepis.1